MPPKRKGRPEPLSSVKPKRGKKTFDEQDRDFGNPPKKTKPAARVETPDTQVSRSTATSTHQPTRRGRLAAPKIAVETATSQENTVVESDMVYNLQTSLYRPVRLLPRIGGFPRFDTGTIYIKVSPCLLKYVYIFEESVLTRFIPFFAKDLGERFVDDCPPCAKMFEEQSPSTKAHYELFFDDMCKIWALRRTSLSKLKPKPKPDVIDLSGDEDVASSAKALPQPALPPLQRDKDPSVVQPAVPAPVIESNGMFANRLKNIDLAKNQSNLQSLEVDAKIGSPEIRSSRNASQDPSPEAILNKSTQQEVVDTRDSNEEDILMQDATQVVVDTRDSSEKDILMQDAKQEPASSDQNTTAGLEPKKVEPALAPSVNSGEEFMKPEDKTQEPKPADQDVKTDTTTEEIVQDPVSPANYAGTGVTVDENVQGPQPPGEDIEMITDAEDKQQDLKSPYGDVQKAITVEDNFHDPIPPANDTGLRVTAGENVQDQKPPGEDIEKVSAAENDKRDPNSPVGIVTTADGKREHVETPMNEANNVVPAEHDRHDPEVTVEISKDPVSTHGNSQPPASSNEILLENLAETERSGHGPSLLSRDAGSLANIRGSEEQEVQGPGAEQPANNEDNNDASDPPRIVTEIFTNAHDNQDDESPGPDAAENVSNTERKTPSPKSSRPNSGTFVKTDELITPPTSPADKAKSSSLDTEMLDAVTPVKEAAVIAKTLPPVVEKEFLIPNQENQPAVSGHAQSAEEHASNSSLTSLPCSPEKQTSPHVSSLGIKSILKSNDAVKIQKDDGARELGKVRLVKFEKSVDAFLEIERNATNGWETALVGPLRGALLLHISKGNVTFAAATKSDGIEQPLWRIIFSDVGIEAQNFYDAASQTQHGHLANDSMHPPATSTSNTHEGDNEHQTTSASKTHLPNEEPASNLDSLKVAQHSVPEKISGPVKTMGSISGFVESKVEESKINVKGHPPQGVCEAYNNFFLLLHNQEPNFGADGPQNFVLQIKAVADLAAYYGCSDVMRSYLQSELFNRGPEVYLAIKEDPQGWLMTGYRLQSPALFRESMVHMIGAHQKDRLASLPPILQSKIQEKAAELQLIQDQVKNDLMLTTIVGPDDYTSHSSSVQAIWHHYITQTIKGLPPPSKAGRFFRAVSEGGDAYFPVVEVYKHLREQRGESELLDFVQINSDLNKLKARAQQIVQPLTINNSLLDVKTANIDHLTCANVDEFNTEWLELNQYTDGLL